MRCPVGGSTEGLAIVRVCLRRNRPGPYQLLAGYHPFHAARAALLRRAGQTTEAVEAHTQAIALAASPAEKAYLCSRRQDLQA